MWMIYLFLIVATFAHALDTGFVSASERSPESVYKLEDIVQLSLQHNPAIAGAQALLEQSEGQRVTAGSYLNPTVTACADRGSIRDPSNGISVTERTFSIEQALE